MRDTFHPNKYKESTPQALPHPHCITGNVPEGVHKTLHQVSHRQPLKAEQLLSASQYVQRFTKPLAAQKLILCSQPLKQNPRFDAFCVDHQLRPESSTECQQAAEQASAMGLESHTMQVQWPQLPASGHMMEQASIMRYQLLHQACKARNISVLLTGHHAGRHHYNSCTYKRHPFTSSSSQQSASKP